MHGVTSTITPIKECYVVRMLLEMQHFILFCFYLTCELKLLSNEFVISLVLLLVFYPLLLMALERKCSLILNLRNSQIWKSCWIIWIHNLSNWVINKLLCLRKNNIVCCIFSNIVFKAIGENVCIIQRLENTSVVIVHFLICFAGFLLRYGLYEWLLLQWILLFNLEWRVSAMPLISNDSQREDSSETEPILSQSTAANRSGGSSSSIEITVGGSDFSVSTDDSSNRDADENSSLVHSEQPLCRICLDTGGFPNLSA